MKRNEGIILSDKYGVNPSVLHCFICGKEIGVALLGKLKKQCRGSKRHDPTW